MPVLLILSEETCTNALYPMRVNNVPCIGLYGYQLAYHGKLILGVAGKLAQTLVLA